MNQKIYYTIINFSYLAIFILILLMLFIIANSFFSSKNNSITSDINNQKIDTKNVKNNENDEEKMVSNETVNLNVLNINNNVNFTSQAPFWDWSNNIYEEWCEEASVIMAIYWARWLNLTSEIASKEIQNISDFEAKTFWTYIDTSIDDTAKVIKEYFSFTWYTVKKDIKKSDIIQSLNNWNILLIPAFWRDLKNPYYNVPWPVEHMIVITWYNQTNMEFITNDPWTRNWKWFRYDEDLLYNAIWSYPTSKTKLSTPKANEKRQKDMIEIYKT